MSSLKRNISRVAGFSTVILLGIAISAGIYFLKIQKNENIQNQLQFRELKDATNEIDQSLQKLKKIAENFSAGKACDLTNPTIIQRKIDWYASCQAVTSEKLDPIRENYDLANISLNKKFVPTNVKRDATLSVSDAGLLSINTQLAMKINPISQLSRIDVTLEQNISDIIPANLERYSLIMIVNENGEILARRDYNLGNGQTKDLSFSSVNALFGEQEDGNAGIKLQQSSMFDVTIAGIDYRLYSQVFNNKELFSTGENRFIIGLVPLSTINFNKLFISPTMIMWSVLVLLFLVTLTPLLKLRFVNSKYAFTGTDVSQIALGIVLCAGVLSVAANQQLFYKYFLNNKIDQAKHIHQQIKSDFSKEINALINHVESKAYATSYANQLNGSTNEYNITNIENSSLAFAKDDGQNNYIIEQLATIDSSAGFASGSNVHYINDALFINRINISSREYFKNAMNCDTWQFADHLETVKGCRKSVYMQRINNIEDGRKNTMLAIPQFENANDPDKQIVIFNSRLQTFMHRILPMNFGYAVINQQGDVLYHSDDNNSLIENLFTETNRNQQLITAVNHHVDADSPLPIDVKYAGEDHLFVTAPLVSKDGERSLPWHLVVFYDETDIAINNMILVFLAVFVLFLVIIPIFIMLRFVAVQNYWSRVLYFQAKKVNRYRVWALFFGSISVLCLSTLGITHDLLSRLLVWLAAGLFVVLFLQRVHKVPLKDHYVSKYPQTGLAVVVAILLVLVMFSDGIHTSPSTLNYVAFAISLVCALLAYLVVINKVPRAISKHFNLDLGQNPPMDGKVKFQNKIEDCRYNAGFVAYLLSLVVLAGMVPATFVVNSTHGYLLQRQANMQSEQINRAYQAQQDAKAQYFDFAKQDEAKSKTLNTPIEFSQLQAIFPKATMELDEASPITAWIKNVELADKNETARVSDHFIDIIFAGLSIQDTLGTKLNFYALVEQSKLKNLESAPPPLTSKQSAINLYFSPDMYMSSASITQWPNVVFGVLFVIGFLYQVLKRVIVRRLMGEHIPDHYRVVIPKNESAEQQNKWPMLKALSQAVELDDKYDGDSIHILLLNAGNLMCTSICKSLNIALYKQQIFHIRDLLEQNADIFVFEEELKHQMQVNQLAQVTLAISGLDEIITNQSDRKRAVIALSKLCNIENLHIIVVADTAPGYRILKQEAYAEEFAREEINKVDIDEKLAWSKLLRAFDKEYAWSPKYKETIVDALNIDAIVEYESAAWPELENVKEKFYDYHRRIKSPTHSVEDVQSYWLCDQVVEFFLVHASALYRKQWELCTVDEKVALWQLARGAIINPENSDVITHLTRRGFIYRYNGWHIINESFRRFILSAESHGVISHWMDTTRAGLWPIIRIPLFIILFVLIVVVVYSSGFALDSFLGIATTTLGIIPLLLKNLSLIKGSGAGIGD